MPGEPNQGHMTEDLNEIEGLETVEVDGGRIYLPSRSKVRKGKLNPDEEKFTKDRLKKLKEADKLAKDIRRLGGKTTDMEEAFVKDRIRNIPDERPL